MGCRHRSAIRRLHGCSTGSPGAYPSPGATTGSRRGAPRSRASYSSASAASSSGMVHPAPASPLGRFHAGESRPSGQKGRHWNILEQFHTMLTPQDNPAVHVRVPPKKRQEPVLTFCKRSASSEKKTGDAAPPPHIPSERASSHRESSGPRI